MDNNTSPKLHSESFFFANATKIILYDKQSASTPNNNKRENFYP